MNISGIYKIESIKKSERCYIGSAFNISVRWGHHLSVLRNNKHHSIKLQHHYNKYGETDLRFSVVLGCEKEELRKLEQYFIDSYKPYFNILPVAGSRLGVKATEETKKKMSMALKGKKKRPMSEGGKRNISKAHLDHIHSEDTKQKMSLSQKGKHGKKGIKFSEEAKKNMSLARMGNIPWNKGLKTKEETKFKMSIANSGKKLTDEQRENLKRAWVIRKQNKIA